MTAAAIIATAVTLVTVVAVLASYVWAAREDGRDQRRRDQGHHSR